MIRILLVEDDMSLGGTLHSRLKKEGYDVEWAQSLKQAREAVSTQSLDLVILDLGLPDGSGFEFARELKISKPLPIIFVTAMNSAENRLEGYEIGAEEFIPKPFHLKELFLRIQHVLENHRVPYELKVLSTTLNMSERSVVNDQGEKVFLAPRDFSVLELLIRRSPQVVSRNDILDLVVGEDQFPTQRTIDNSILRLRQAFGDREGAILRSVRGVGYQWLNENKEDKK